MKRRAQLLWLVGTVVVAALLGALVRPSASPDLPEGLRDLNIERVRLGMTRAEVEAQVGKPTSVPQYGLTRELSEYAWRYWPVQPDGSWRDFNPPQALPPNSQVRPLGMVVFSESGRVRLIAGTAVWKGSLMIAKCGWKADPVIRALGAKIPGLLLCGTEPITYAADGVRLGVTRGQIVHLIIQVPVIRE
jgi:hypothetical protein